MSTETKTVPVAVKRSVANDAFVAVRREMSGDWPLCCLTKEPFKLNEKICLLIPKRGDFPKCFVKADAYDRIGHDKAVERLAADYEASKTYRCWYIC